MINIAYMKIQKFYKIDPNEWLLLDHPYIQKEYKLAKANPKSELEEYVRQWVLRELIETYNYPKEWLGSRIVIEYQVMINTVTNAYPDIAILNERLRPFLFVECKKQTEKLEGSNNAIEQLQSALSVTYTTNVGMATNGNDVKVFLKQIDPKEFIPHPDIPEYKLRDNPNHKQPSRLLKSSEFKKTIQERKIGLQTLDVKNFQRVLFDCHSIMRDHNGLHADQALDEMCKLLYTKIYDEISTPLEKEFQFQTWIYSNTEELGSSIRFLYEEAIEKDLAEMDSRIKGYSSSRGVFKDKILLNDSVLEMIVEKLQKFSLIDTDVDVRGQAFETFLKGKVRQAMGQYFTPEPLIRLMIGILNPNEKDLIIDPACGSGRFLTKSLKFVRESVIIPKFGENSEMDKDFREKRLHGIEISPMLCRLAMTDMFMYGDGHSNIRCTDGLGDWAIYADIKPMSFSICVTNPPFGSKIKDKNVLQRFNLGKGKNRKTIRKGQKKEALFLERCLEFLQPGGKLAIILPEGILENTSDSYIRNWYRNVAKIIAIISLPEYTFIPFGANVETSILFLRKWKKDENKLADYQVFMAKISDITYLSDGRDCKCEICSKHRIDPKIPDEIDALISYFHKVVKW